MPHVSSGGGDDLGSTDEVKVFKDEGEDEKRSSENLTEEKSSLIDLTESEEKSSGSLAGQSYSSSKNASRSPVYDAILHVSQVYEATHNSRKLDPTPHTSSFNMGYLVSPYPYPNGSAGPIPVSMASKMGLGPTHPGASLPFFCHNGDHLSQPPPAHMGIPPYQLDPKGTGPMGLARPPMYPFSAGQYPYPMLSPEMSQVASWHTPSMYPISTGGGGFRSPYPTTLPITSTSCLTSDLYRFSPLPPPPGLSPHSHSPHHHSLASHPAIVTPGPKQPDLQANTHHHAQHRQSSMDQKNSTSVDNSKNQDSNAANNNQDKKKPHIKKPLNAFMLYMKEMRAKVVAECTLKESAAINQILGRRWHSLTREEQAKYYDKARQERQLHMQLYPGWSARDNYGYGAKKKKRKKERSSSADAAGGNSMKKCRARYGLDQQSQWCKPCRRKKKCIRYMEAGDSVDGNQSEDNLGSSGSVGEAQTPPDDDNESLHRSISSPGCLSGLSSLTSPSMILPSPSTSLASPSVSLASPCMSLQSPLTPHHDMFECKVPVVPLPAPHRNPVGTNPHDINNPLSVNQLTGQCVKQEKDSRAVIGVT